jgi:hypothetical protein
VDVWMLEPEQTRLERINQDYNLYTFFSSSWKDGSRKSYHPGLYWLDVIKHYRGKRKRL